MREFKGNEYYNAEETCKNLKRSMTSVCRYRNIGVLVPIKILGSNYYLKSDVDNLKKFNKKKPKTV